VVYRKPPWTLKTLLECFKKSVCSQPLHFLSLFQLTVSTESLQRCTMETIASDLLVKCSRGTHTRLTALCLGLPGWAGTRKVKPIWILLKQETVSGSGISWAVCKSAPRSRQITTPAPHHSDFYMPDTLPAAQPTASKHGRVIVLLNIFCETCNLFSTRMKQSQCLLCVFVILFVCTRCLKKTKPMLHVITSEHISPLW